MNRLLLLCVTTLMTCGIYAQRTFTCYVLVKDLKTNNPISGATITIDQTGLDTKHTASDGKCIFLNVPEGKIDYTVTCPGYKTKKSQFNISSDIPSNTLEIYLSPNSPIELQLTGEVTDQKGAELAGVNVEVVLDGIPYRGTTDESGNYRIIIPLNSAKDDKIKIEYKLNKCRHTETIQIPDRKIITKDIALNCKSDELNSDYNDTFDAFYVGLLPFSMVISRQQNLMSKYIEERQQFIELCEKLGFPIRHSAEELTPEFIMSTLFSQLTSFMTINTTRERREAFLLARNFDELLVTWFFKDNEFKEKEFLPMIENYENILRNNILLNEALNNEGLTILRNDFRSNLRRGYNARAKSYYNLLGWMYEKVLPHLKSIKPK